MNVYLESSVLLRRLLNQPAVLADWGQWSQAHTSELTRLEASRAIERLRLEGRLDDEQVARGIGDLGVILESLNIIRLDSRILDAASRSFPVVIRSLDAIHLASALMCQDDIESRLVFLTHDVRLGIAAKALAFETRGFALP